MIPLNLITTRHLGNCLSDLCSPRMGNVLLGLLAGLTVLTGFPAVSQKSSNFSVQSPSAGPSVCVTIPKNRYNPKALDHLYDLTWKNQRPSSKQARERNDLPVGRDLQKALQNFHVFSVTGRNAAETLGQLKRSGLSGIWVDRRVDKSRLIRLNSDSRRVIQSLHLVAGQLDSKVVMLEEFVVIVPREKAGELLIQLEANLEIARKLPPAVRKKLLEKTEATWDKLSKPSEIFHNDLKKVKELEFAGPSLPHDLWDKDRFPKTKRITLLTLLAFGFDKQISFSKSGNSWSVSIKPTQTKKDVKLTVRSFFARSNLRKNVKSYKKSFPNLRITSKQNSFQISGPRQDVANLLLQANQLVYQPPKKVPNGKAAFSLVYSGPNTVQVLQALSKQTKRRLILSNGHMKKLQATPVKVDVKDVSFDQLIGQVLKGSGFKATVDESSIRITKE